MTPVRFVHNALARAQQLGRTPFAAPVALAAIGAVLFLGFGALRAPARAPAAPVATAAAALGDTIVVYGPRRFETPTGSAANHIERFAVAVQPGQRYTLRVDNGNPDGSGRVTGGSLKLNGSEILSSATLAAGGPGWRRVVQVLVEDTLKVTVQGAAGAALTVALEATADASFLVFGPERFIRTTGTPSTDVRQFAISPTAAAPYRLCIVNGNPDGTQRLSSATITLNGVEVLTQSDLNQQVGSLIREVTLQAQNTVEIRLTAKPQGFLDLCFTATDVTPPVLTVTAPAPGFITRDAQVTVSGTVADETATEVTVNGLLATRTGNAYSAVVPLAAEGANAITVTAVDAAGLRTDSLRTVIRDTQAPVLVVTAPADGLVTPQAAVTVTGTVTDQTAVTVNVNGIPLEVGAGGGFSGEVALSEGVNFVTVTATDAATNSTSETRTVTRSAGGLPPDPATVATPIDPTVVTTLAAATEFLYTGSNPIQTGVEPGTINPVRAAVLRGKVLTRAGLPLSGVTITVLGHPELGQTLSRADGMFDLAVNGGGQLTVSYEKAGFLPAQRPMEAPWQDYSIVDDVVLIGVDPQVTTVDLASPAVQVARGTAQTDADGTRQATLLFLPGTQAELVMPGGSTQPLSSLSVRATEYTVGEMGPKMMPAPLPPTSAYTYAVELSVDQALAAGATTVRFSQPVPFYVEDFLGFPVGTAVPAGRYDFVIGAWIPEDNGRVLRVLGQTAGLVQLDADGDGAADDETALAALGITAAEQGRLATLYPAGTTLWRAPVRSFSPWDLNFPFIAPPDARDPEVALPRGAAPGADVDRVKAIRENHCQNPGSIVGCQPQTLGEALGIVGTSFGVYYASGRAPGRRDAYGLDIPLSRETVPASLVRIVLEVWIAGRAFADTFPPVSNQTTTFVWDGEDAYGRRMQGPQTATVRVSYIYPVLYAGAPDLARAFGVTCTGTSTTECIIPLTEPGSSLRLESVRSQAWRTLVGKWEERENGLSGAGLGGWSLGAHHVYDPGNRILWLGTGDWRTSALIGRVITTLAGGGSETGDGVPATEAELDDAIGVAVAPDGVVYIADNDRVRRVGLDGIITTVAGTGEFGYGGDGGPATAAQLAGAASVALGPDGSLYIADQFNSRIRRVGPGGIITTVAGTGDFAFGGDGGPATAAQLNSPSGVALGTDGSLYIADFGNSRVRRVGMDGTINTVAGTGAYGSAGDGGLATQAQLGTPRGIAVGPDGSVYIADQFELRIRRVGPDGIITTVAGTGDPGFAGDGGPAVNAQLACPADVALGADGSLFIADECAARIRAVGPDGIITTVAGASGPTCAPAVCNGGSALYAALDDPEGVAVAPDGSLYVGDEDFAMVFRVGPALPGVSPSELRVASEDGGLLYVFDAFGRHLRTLDGLTGTLRLAFSYDGAGLPVAVTDGDGNVTTIERDAAGRPTAFVAPFGQRTQITLNGEGLLSALRAPGGETVQLGYAAGGLLSSVTDARGQVHRFTYDAVGRLIRDENPAGGFLQLARTETENGFVVTKTSSLGRTTSYGGEEGSAGDETASVTWPSGLATESRVSDTLQSKTRRDGTVISLALGPDPRLGMQVPAARRLTTTLPSGLSATLRVSKAYTLANPDDPFSVVTRSDTITFNGRAFVSTYDAATRVHTNQTAEGRVARVFTDERARESRLEVPGLTAWTSTYDTRGRLAEETRGTRVWRYVYGPSGRLTQVEDPLGRATVFTTDSVGRVTQIQRADGSTIGYQYDAKGNMISITAPGGATHGFAYNVLDQTSQYMAPGGTATTYEYNVEGELTGVGRPDGSAVVLEYDPAGRESGFQTADGRYGLTYEATTGAFREMNAPSGSVLRYTHDGYLATGAVWDGPVQGSIEIAYDGDFRAASLGVNGGDAVSMQYDRDGVLTQAGALALTRRQDNGLLIGAAVGGITSSWTHSEFAEVADHDTRFGTQSLARWVYTRDALGRVSAVTETIAGGSHTHEYAYDLAGRLSEVRRDGATVASFEYDANGNRLRVTRPTGTVTGAYDQQDRLFSFGDATFSYAPSGELLTKTVGADVTSYHYDAVGNLLNVTLPDGTLIEYVIDPKGRRIGKRVNGTLVQGFLYQSQLAPIVELDGAGQIVSRFVYGTHVNVPDYMVRNGVTYRLVTDQLGSVRLVVNASTGDVVQQIDYDESGQVTLNTNPGFQPFGFAGGLYDDDTRLVHFNARDYDPSVGRWTAKDPIGFLGGPNLYEYANGDPVNRTDPAGWCDTKNDGFAPNGPGILRAANNSGEWKYSQGRSGFNVGLQAWAEPVRNTADYKGGEHIGDCTDDVYWAAGRAIPGWFDAHPYDDYGGKGKIATSGFLDQSEGWREGLRRHGWEPIEPSARRAGDIVVTGSHAGIYVCTDDQCRVWGLANNGVPTKPDIFGSPSGYGDNRTGEYDFSKNGGTPRYFRPVAP